MGSGLSRFLPMHAPQSAASSYTSSSASSFSRILTASKCAFPEATLHRGKGESMKLGGSEIMLKPAHGTDLCSARTTLPRATTA